MKKKPLALMNKVGCSKYFDRSLYINSVPYLTAGKPHTTFGRQKILYKSGK